MHLPWRKESNCNILRVFIYSKNYPLFNPLSKQDVKDRGSHSGLDSYFSQWSSCVRAYSVCTKNSSTRRAFLEHFHYSHDAASYITHALHVIPPSAVHTDASGQKFPLGTVVLSVLKAKASCDFFSWQVYKIENSLGFWQWDFNAIKTTDSLWKLQLFNMYFFSLSKMEIFHHLDVAAFFWWLPACSWAALSRISSSLDHLARCLLLRLAELSFATVITESQSQFCHLKTLFVPPSANLHASEPPWLQHCYLYCFMFPTHDWILSQPPAAQFFVQAAKYCF